MIPLCAPLWESHNTKIRPRLLLALRAILLLPQPI
jgi:hypothetical protein